MVGFVLIIVLVSIIAVIFLAIAIRKPADIQGSKEIDNFLSASLLHTTGCKSSNNEVYDLRDLIAACYNGEECQEGSSCEILKTEAEEMIEEGWQIGENNKNRGYVYRIYYGNETMISINKEARNSTSRKAGEIPIPTREENLNVRLELQEST